MKMRVFPMRTIFSGREFRISGEILRKHGSYIALFILMVLSGIIQPIFFHPQNIFNLLLKAAPLGVVTLGQFFVILGGGFDLSVASLMATTNIVAAAGMYGRNEMCLSVSLLCLGLGILVGLTNGLLITKRRIPPFIMTLGMMIFLQGVRFVWTKGAPFGTIPLALRFIGKGSIGGIPLSVILLAILAIGSFVVLTKTTYGRQLYSTGGNWEAARLSGVNVDRVIILTYIISGFMAALAGLLLTGYLGLSDNWAGKGYELKSIASVVIGGAALTGGRGTVGGTIAGVLIMTILDNIVLLLNLEVEIQMIVEGIVIIGAVAFYTARKSH